ncbi:pentapeptide repeat-containing protein [Burkholderia cenocepacia]|nr:pentapeptide repeat-containing protein [Burkholderia cenocepacia]RRA14455.1 pentapeptide repeat-containing protein [Burkholderia cenocepacia]
MVLSNSNGVARMTKTTVIKRIGRNEIVLSVENEIDSQSALTADIQYSRMLADAIQRAASSGVDFRNADFSNLDLRRLNLTGLDLRGADLSGSVLDSTLLAFANLADANLCGIRMVSGSLAHANLRGANLIGACISHTDMTGALFWPIDDERKCAGGKR